MNNDHEGDVRGFYHLSEAWYGPANLIGSKYTDEVNFGFFCPEGGTSGEMSLKWDNIGGCLHVWHDAWETLFQFSDVVAALAEYDGENITPKTFCVLLSKLGFKDLTPRLSPYGNPDTSTPRRETMLENTLTSLVDAVVNEDTPQDIKKHINNAKQLLGRR